MPSFGGRVPAPALERPRDEANGDWASTVAMRSAKLAKRNPREIAQIIVDHLPENDLIQSVEVAGPGFINVRLTPATFQGVVRQVRAEGQDFGKGAPKPEAGRINLEYVSANPTGPMHVGHGRWAALGDAMARVMRHAGYDVSEEFYINDHGVQMDVFGNSVSVRYQQLLGRDVEMPEKCYGGSYVADIAQGIIDRDGDKWLSVSDEERVAAFRELAYKEMLKLMQDTLGGFGVHFDRWFSERALYVPDEAGETAVILFYNGRYVVRKNQQADAHNAKVIQATDAKNAEIAQSNALVSQKRAELMNRYDQVCGELKQNTGSWFPPDYYSLEAVEHFIKAVENHKADTVKEMILEYDQSMDRQQMLESQRQTNLKLDKIASNQEVNNELLKEQNKLIRQGNAIQMMKMFQDQFNHNDSMNEQRRTRAAINNNTQATRDFHKEVKDIFHRW